MYGIQSLDQSYARGLSPAALSSMAALEAATGRQFDVTSAYRDPSHNQRVGGARGSQHIEGNAYDINVADMSVPERIKLIEQARAAGFRGIGVYNNSLHFDVGPDRAWGPDYTRGSLPAWASQAVTAPIGDPATVNAGVSNTYSSGGYKSNNPQPEQSLFDPDTNPMFNAGFSNPYVSTRVPVPYMNLGTDNVMGDQVDPFSGLSDFSQQIYNMGL